MCPLWYIIYIDGETCKPNKMKTKQIETFYKHHTLIHLPINLNLIRLHDLLNCRTNITKAHIDSSFLDDEPYHVGETKILQHGLIGEKPKTTHYTDQTEKSVCSLYSYQ